ncbi:hypothetical protein E3P81_00460 [Wallemia ichthyophaga]|nr:hypothetical protein E3P97_00462 [Wallemia ichthyophaga]TIB06409.1 hypothetical protein E3P96_00487 [Wallemia ichthyophaga]TIB32402.1 hypothetical protein E3P85_01901 [Wallemia ichthyophaga]TIB50245.1 hypothetical protein E3P82_00574 [Wallemia ichthyophaga]TIB53998.1 hypothetical protein E3P81_00460 [Wallemia ichthyophaga]
MKLSALITLAVALTVFTDARAVETRQEDGLGYMDGKSSTSSNDDMKNTKSANVSDDMYDAYHQSNDYDKYPTPKADGGKAWEDAFKKAKDVVSQMTVDEKGGIVLSHDGRCVGTTHGVERLGIPELCMMDGPTGVRPVHGVSSYPVGQAAAATWDRELIYQRSKHMGQEFFDKGVNVALAPVASGPLGRSPLMGRNWEGSFADSYSNGIYTYESVTGLQDSHVSATIKHFIGYEQETARHPYQTDSSTDQEPISSNIDDRTMHEVYMPSFAEGVRAGSGMVMCSYNNINGTTACGNAHAQNGLLKTELNFEGAIISDWGGVHSDVDSIMSGLDGSFPGVGYGGGFGSFWEDLPELVKNGSVSESRLDDACHRMLTPYFWLGQDGEHTPPEVKFVGNPYFEDGESTYTNVRDPSSTEVLRDLATDSVTLLKNNGGLPLNRPQRLAAVGALDGTDVSACSDSGTSCNYTMSTITIGGGSGYTFSPYEVTPLDAIKEKVIQQGTELSYALENDEDVINEISSRADATLVFVSEWAEEGEDRDDLDIVEEQAKILDTAVKASSNVILVLNTPGVVDIEKWADNDNVTAIVETYYPGQESGNGLVPILFGEKSPSGKLPYTWGKKLSDWPENTIVRSDDENPQSYFKDGLFFDYKWFDKQDIEPRYEFGFGLSYTNFEFSNISVEDNHKKDDKEIQATNEPFASYDGSNSFYDTVKTVKATVTNTGDMDSSEVVQLYVTIPSEGEPIRQLRGFEKVKNLKSGESKQVEMDLRIKDLSVWDVVQQTWVMPSGEYVFYVGNSSRDLPLKVTCSN